MNAASGSAGTIEALFSTSPSALPLYQAATEKILALPDVAVKIGKSQVSFRSRRSFAWIWLPIRKVKGRPETYIVLSFGLDHQIVSPRIVSAVEPYPNRWTHHVIITASSDLDDEVMSWLTQAHKFASLH